MASSADLKHAKHEQGMSTAASDATADAGLVDRLEGEYAAMTADLRAVFRSGRTRSADWRAQQLKNMRKGFVENVDAINEALNLDLGRHPMEGVFAEVAGVIAEIDHALENLDSWMTPQKQWHPLAVQPGNSTIVYEPKGVILVLAPWNYPISLAFNCMVACIVAGNCLVVKPSEVSPNCARVIEDICNRYLDNDAIKVVQGAVPETTALLRVRYDHIIYTGNGAVGRIVQTAAAKHLTPTTLELGGKSPVYVDKSAKVPVVAKRIAGGKSLNNGQTCIAPDYVLVHESVALELVAELKESFLGFFGPDPITSDSYGRVVNQRHWDRVVRLLDPASHRGEVLTGGADKAVRDEKYIPPTLILNPDPESPLMHEEIFSMALPILVVKDENEAIDFITAREHPLALYVMAEDQVVLDKLRDNTTSGGMCQNDVLFHIVNPYLPFGGVGSSGMGSYHGVHGFKTCSHEKSVMYRSTWIDPKMRYPPYNDKTVEGIRKFVVSEGMDPRMKKAIMAAGVTAVGAIILSRL